MGSGSRFRPPNVPSAFLKLTPLTTIIVLMSFKLNVVYTYDALCSAFGPSRSAETAYRLQRTTTTTLHRIPAQLSLWIYYSRYVDVVLALWYSLGKVLRICIVTVNCVLMLPCRKINFTQYKSSSFRASVQVGLVFNLSRCDRLPDRVSSAEVRQWRIQVSGEQHAWQRHCTCPCRCHR